MDAALEPTNPARGPARLLEHFAALERLGRPRPPARDRLRHVLGSDLASLLLRALAGDRRQPARGLTRPT